ncbi:MAG: histidinol phosphate phosphatase [Flavobacteriales bacterium]|nr:histidinol phosphate phosphatase [Flavobacteriales bacterium]
MVNKAVFLDRDGVINHDPDDYTYRLHETTILPGIIEFAQKVKEKGYLIIVITNQGGISKGRYSHAHVDAVNDFIQTEFNKAGVTIEEFFYCPHHNAMQACLCRKPDSLLIERGLYKYDVDPSHSYFIGDKWRDVECGEKAGVHGIKIDVNVISDSLIDLIA